MLKIFPISQAVFPSAVHCKHSRSRTVSGAVFFWAGLLSAFSSLVAVHIARRIGRTMPLIHGGVPPP